MKNLNKEIGKKIDEKFEKLIKKIGKNIDDKFEKND